MTLGERVRAEMLDGIRQIAEIRHGGIQPPKLVAVCDSCDEFTHNCHEPYDMRWHEDPTTINGDAMDAGWYCQNCRDMMDSADEND